MPYLLALTALITAVVVWRLLSRRPPSAATLRARLLRMVQGDAAVLARLLDHEQQQAPGISEREALRRALVRLRRDRR